MIFSLIVFGISVGIGSRAAIALPISPSLEEAFYLTVPHHHLEQLMLGDRLIAQLTAEALDGERVEKQAQPEPEASPQKKPNNAPADSEPTEESDSSSSADESRESQPDTESQEEPDSSAAPEQPSESEEPLKTYFLNLISDHPRQQIKLNPPATEIKVSVGGGANSVLCSDGMQTYTCASGNPLVITRDRDNPITQFWAQNSGGGSARIRITVYK